MIGYTCKYTPVEIFYGFDEECFLVNDESTDFEYAHNFIHPNTCSYVKSVIEQIKLKNIHNFIFVNCCDSLRRGYDCVKNELGGFTYLMDLPHDNNSVSLFKNEIINLIKAYESYSGKTFDLLKFKSKLNCYSKENESNIVFMGSRVGNEFKKLVENYSPTEISDHTCLGSRRFLNFDINDENFDSVISQYSKILLNQLPCLRMNNISSRVELLPKKSDAIIYHTTKFCDYYDFEYEKIRKLGLFTIKIETDYTKQSLGQITTRLEAFFEQLNKNNLTVSSADNVNGNLYVGVDSGSTTTNLVAMNCKKQIVATATVSTGFNAQSGAEKALKQADVQLNNVKKIVATGYGRKNISFVNDYVTEITCHSKGANYFNKNCNYVIDIGGQDSKVIEIDSKGNVVNFVMNDKCAAGTGRFIENMSRVLELTVEQVALRGSNYKEDLSISSMCTVFAESEVVSLIAQNKGLDDIIHALNKSVATKTVSLVKRLGAKGSFIMTGGVGNNNGVVAELQKQLDESIFVPDDPSLCGAVGAALIAIESNN